MQIEPLENAHAGFHQKLIDMRREFHRYPELSGEESETATRVCRLLDELKISYRSGIGGNGVLAEIPGQKEKPFIALRTDMDALPVKEETGLEFSSEYQGVMHACGHDGHMAVLIGAAELLLRENLLSLPVRLIFQPAEETGQGAKAMIQDGALEDVAMVFGGHLDRHYPSGTIVVSQGAVNASSDQFDIRISGQSGHGARPHETVDAVVVGSLMVMALQTIVSREVDPAFPSVVSIGEFKAGTKANVIAGEAVLKGTIRTQHPRVREQLEKAIERIARSIGELHGAKVEVDIRFGTPALINNKNMVSLARKAAARVVGQERVRRLHTANMGGEDFSYYMEHVPGCYVRYGALGEGHIGYPAHSSQFDIDEHALPVAASYLAEIAKIAMSQAIGTDE
jgi:hippurate hydrolase